jgi:hypothetical protein
MSLQDRATGRTFAIGGGIQYPPLPVLRDRQLQIPGRTLDGLRPVDSLQQRGRLLDLLNDSAK